MLIKSIKAQVVIEMTLAWIILLILLIGTTGLFVWFNLTMVERQKAYERTRLAAGMLEFDCDSAECQACAVDECSGMCDPCGNIYNCSVFSRSCLYTNCFHTGRCFTPKVAKDGVSGSTFYNPEPLKIFKR